MVRREATITCECPECGTEFSYTYRLHKHDALALDSEHVTDELCAECERRLGPDAADAIQASWD